VSETSPDSPSPAQRVAGRSAPWTLVWEWPLRIWHWLFAVCIGASLYTGLAGDIALMDAHLLLGYCALGLVLFRLLWGLWGGPHARLASYATTPRQVLDYFRGHGAGGAHTPPGAMLALALLLLVTLQAVAGLFTTDEIFTEGPLVTHAPEPWVAFMSAAHHRIFWLVLTAIGVHLCAHVIYGLRRDPTPLSMFTGRKRVGAAAAQHQWGRAMLTAAAAAAAVYVGLRLA
jgi:cytochrome b